MTDEIYETTVRFLDPQEIRFVRNKNGRLDLHLGDESYEAIRLTRSFPHTAPEDLVSVSLDEGKEIGVIEDLRSLPRATRKLVDEELELTYFSPIIRKITKVVQHFGASSWHVETDRGSQILRIRERGDIRWLPGSKVVFTDVHGIRYDIPDAALLDETSRTLLEQET